MSSGRSHVLTIGHSNHAAADFLALLRQHAATAVADVRSAPYSRFNPQFNREALRHALTEAGIAYVYLGRELGGRSDNPACYEGGRIRYDRVAETRNFKDGLRRLESGIREHRVALMCAEKEPLHCHRTLLVSQALDARRRGRLAHPRQRPFREPRQRHGSPAGGRPPARRGRSARAIPRGPGGRRDSLANGAGGLCAFRRGSGVRAMRLLTIGFTKKPAQRFMRERRIEETVDPALLDAGCLLCSEDQPTNALPPRRRVPAGTLGRCRGGAFGEEE